MSIESAVAKIMASRYQPRVGDRVRVTGAIGECQVEWIANPVRGHAIESLGMTGTVVSYPACWPSQALKYGTLQGHAIAVLFDELISWEHPVAGKRLGGGGLFAPTELELIAAGAPADEGA